MRQFITWYYYDDPVKFREQLEQQLNKWSGRFRVVAMSTVEKYWGWRIFGLKTYHTNVIWEWVKNNEN